MVYILTDCRSILTAYSWAAAYLWNTAIDFVYIKHVHDNRTQHMVLGAYDNLEVPDAIPHGVAHNGEAEEDLMVLLMFGLAIPFFGFSRRMANSATIFFLGK